MLASLWASASKKKFLLFIVLIIAAPLITWVALQQQELRQRASESPNNPNVPTATFSLEPAGGSSTTVDVGQDMYFELHIDTGTTRVVGLDVTIVFDPTKLEFKGFPTGNTPGFDVVASTYSNVSAVNISGQFRHAITSTTSSITGKTILGIVNLKAKTLGAGAISLKDIQVIAEGYAGVPLNTNTTGGTYAVSSPVTPTTAIALPRCVASSIPPNTGPAPLTVTLHGGGAADAGTSVVGYQWDFENDGTWDTEVSIEPVNHTYTTPGAYTPKYRIQGLNNTWSPTCNYAFLVNVYSPPPPTSTPVPPTATAVPPPPTTTSAPIPGEIDGIPGVNILDYNIWRDEFVANTTTKRADLNKDNKVDLLDFSLWREAFTSGSVGIVATPTPDSAGSVRFRIAREVPNLIGLSVQPTSPLTVSGFLGNTNGSCYQMKDLSGDPNISGTGRVMDTSEQLTPGKGYVLICNDLSELSGIATINVSGAPLTIADIKNRLVSGWQYIALPYLAPNQSYTANSFLTELSTVSTHNCTQLQENQILFSSGGTTRRWNPTTPYTKGGTNNFTLSQEDGYKVYCY